MHRAGSKCGSGGISSAAAEFSCECGIGANGGGNVGSKDERCGEQQKVEEPGTRDIWLAAGTPGVKERFDGDPSFDEISCQTNPHFACLPLDLASLPCLS